MEKNILLKEKNILYILCKIFFSTIFSFVIFLDSKLVFVQNIRAKVNEVYFDKTKSNNVISLIITWIITYIILTIIGIIIDKLDKKFYIKKRFKNKKSVFFIILAIILLFWMPYILTYFPGGIFSDTQTSIKQCLRIISYDNVNPLAYTLLIKICLVIGNFFNSAQIGMNIFGIMQILIMASILAYSVYWLYKKNVSIVVLVFITMFFSLFKLFPMYALSIWKDTPFCLALYAYVILIGEIVYKKGKNLNSIKINILYSLLFIEISFLRNNGFYVVLATTICVLIAYRKNKILKFLIFTIITSIVVVMIKGPVFTLIGINKKTNGGGWNAIKISQIFYTEVMGGDINPEQEELINKMCNIEKLKEVYSPFLLDATTVTPEFNNMFISEHKSEIDKLWIDLLLKNPDLYIKGYLLNTLGYWDVNRVFVDAYISDFTWPGTDEIIDFHQMDVIEKITGKSIKEDIKLTRLYSSGIFLFIMLASMACTIKTKKYKNMLMYLPALFTWGTIILAAPIAFSMRYVYILVLMVPYNFIIPFLKTSEGDEEK